MKTTCRAALALSLFAAGAVHAAEPRPFPTPAKAGLRPYTYEVVEVVNGKIQHGYRMTFDLETAADGTTDALVRGAEESDDAKAWRPVAVGDACRTAMHAPAGGLARARLWPVSEDVAKAMGSDFLDTCAPPGVFFPLTDVINVVIIPLTPRFKVSALKRQGDRAAYEGFTAHYDRSGEGLTETSHGGEVSLPSLTGDRVVIDWAPAIADLDLTEKASGQPVHLVGTEHFAFRVTLDARSGALVEAHTTYDNLDLKAHSADMPEGVTAPVKITREVKITPR